MPCIRTGTSTHRPARTLSYRLTQALAQRVLSARVPDVKLELATITLGANLECQAYATQLIKRLTRHMHNLRRKAALKSISSSAHTPRGRLPVRISGLRAKLAAPHSPLGPTRKRTICCRKAAPIVTCAVRGRLSCAVKPRGPVSHCRHLDCNPDTMRPGFSFFFFSCSHGTPINRWPVTLFSGHCPEWPPEPLEMTGCAQHAQNPQILVCHFVAPWFQSHRVAKYLNVPSRTDPILCSSHSGSTPNLPSKARRGGGRGPHGKD